MTTLVPTATMVQHLRHEAARAGGISRPAQFQTLSRFVSSLVPDLRQVSKPLFHLLVEEAVHRCARPEFEKVAQMPGFHASLAQTIELLEAGGCTLNARVETPLAPAFFAVWRTVEAELERRGLVTRAGLLRAATHQAPKGLTVSAQGFHTVTVPERAFLEACGARVEPPHIGDVSACAVRFAANTVEREVDEIARRILEAGRPFREIAIVLRNPDAYTSVLRPALERFGIPARFYFGRPLEEHAVIRYLAGTIDALLSDWEHEQVLTALRNTPTSPAMDRFDIRVREQLPGRGLESLLQLTSLPLLRDFESLDSWRTLKLTPAQWAERLAGLRALFYPGRIADPESWDDAARLHSQATALDAWQSAMEEAAEWFTGDVTLAAFWRIARAFLRLSTLRVDDRRRNVVHVVSAHEARQWSLPAIFVPGLIERQFPRRHPQNAFFPDAALRTLGVETSEDRDREEQQLFDAVACRAASTLVLSYPREEQNLPSRFFTRFDTEIESPGAVRPHPHAAPDKWKPSGAYLSADLLPVLQERHQHFSVTGLESFLQCPFQFFASKTLRLETLPPRPEDRVDFLLQGNIVHRVLAEWFIERPPLEPLFDRVFAECCVEKHIVPGYRTERIRRQMLTDLERFARYEAWPRSQQVETETLIDWHIGESVIVRAKLDRLETLADGSLAIVDYKYSRAENTKAKVKDETKLQGPLYIGAVEQGRGGKVSAMVYYSLRNDPRPFGWGEVAGLDAELEELTPEWLERAYADTLRAVEEQRKGRIQVQPRNLDPCRYCDFADVCRHEQTATLTASY